ncbi:hypothetical protein LTR36_010218 [Oleoguttula mirabilis]|uniref:Uncharacterized protein n=1 Tax=Oleoguttula mirabilis TaxID=1507867 RepID=A0AAV9JS91_9PEZI|nr:hypothetical protein LTR36_010218 [Oleoguttula mirabilis]
MASLNNFDGGAAGKYDPGLITIFWDGRQSGAPPPSEDKMSYYQSYYIAGLYKLGWPSYHTPDLEPGKLRLVFYTHAGSEGTRDYPLWNAYAVKDMFDSLYSEGFRPMLMGFANENPYREIGGSEPPPEPKKFIPRAAKSVSGSYSGHGGKNSGATPHDRIMAIIEKEDEREAKRKREEFEKLNGVEDHEAV